jgi:hypothetical protein
MPTLIRELSFAMLLVRDVTKPVLNKLWPVVSIKPSFLMTNKFDPPLPVRAAKRSWR